VAPTNFNAASASPIQYIAPAPCGADVRLIAFVRGRVGVCLKHDFLDRISPSPWCDLRRSRRYPFFRARGRARCRTRRSGGV
jgi:hypothetical protein